MTRFFTVLPLLFLAACGRSEPPAAASGDETPAPAAATPAATPIEWPVSRGGPQLQGRVNAPLFLTPAIEWTHDLGAPGVAEAASAEGVIVVGDIAGTIHCIDIASRTTRWTFETDDTIHAAPAISGGRVFVGSGDGRFVALDLITGEKIWEMKGGDKFPSAATLVDAPDGSGQWILVNGYDGVSRCLRTADGSEVWTYQTDDHINGTPAIIDGRLVAFGGCDRVVHVLNLADGTRVNEVTTDAQITNTIATAGSMIFCSNHANQVIATEAEADSLSWVYQPGEFAFFTAPAIDDTHVYIGCRDKSLHAIRRADGEGVWTFPTGGRVESSPLAFDNAVVFGSSDGRLYAADLADGTERWRLDLGEDLTAAPVYSGGRLIIAGGRGTLFIIADATAAAAAPTDS
jgi:outer membrane protein assembly factor BamB